MTVHFIGAGPGAPDLITIRGLKLIQSCPVCLYAGSLVPEEIVKAGVNISYKYLLKPISCWSSSRLSKGPSLAP